MVLHDRHDRPANAFLFVAGYCPGAGNISVEALQGLPQVTFAFNDQGRGKLASLALFLVRAAMVAFRGT